MFTKNTKRAIRCVGETCASDAGTSDPTVLAEIACDANRLTVYGYKDADEEVGELVKKHGWMKVMEAASQLF